MAKPPNRSKTMGTNFSPGKSMEIGLHSNFVGGAGSNGSRFNPTLPSQKSIFSDLTGLPMSSESTQSSSAFAMNADPLGSKSSKSLPDSNIGFKLLKKSGWKEGSGLGVAEQGRLDPVETQFKSDKRGIGAEKKIKLKKNNGTIEEASSEGDRKSTTREKNLAKRARKLAAEAERIQDIAFKQEFYREFWPENM